MELRFEYAVKGETKTGQEVIIKRGFRSISEAEDFPIKLSQWRRVWVTALGCITPEEPKPRLRRCLHCKGAFFSEHIGNRLCKSCYDHSKTRGVDRVTFGEG